MAKKRKLNSKNPKYWAKDKVDGPTIKEKRLMCNIPVRNNNGDLIEGISDEAMRLAGHHKLKNLIGFLDNNKLDDEGLSTLLIQPNINLYDKRDFTSKEQTLDKIINMTHNNLSDTTLTVSVFGQFGSLFGNEAAYSTTVDAISGSWTTVDVSWDMNNA